MALNTPWFNSQERSFFNVLNKSKTAHIVLTADTDDFDDGLSQQWIAEGFDVKYVPLIDGGTDFIRRVHAVGDSFGVSEQYAVVGQRYLAIKTDVMTDRFSAFEASASLILEAHTKPNNPRLVAIVAYYPSVIPAVSTKFPASVQVVVHLAGKQVGVRKTPEVLGIQGKQTTVQKRIDPGAGFGETLKLSYKAYTYSGVQPGFAEHDLDEYDAAAAGTAFTRSLAVVRRGFRIENDIETIRDRYTQSANTAKLDEITSTVHARTQVMYTPTLIGGIGSEDIVDFYANFFDPLSAQADATIRLLSRTIGTDRVVDEMYLSFKHSTELAWCLPGVSPTMKSIEIVVVSIFHVRGTKLESEHVYWDQASVLVQAGLLDPKVVPDAIKKEGMTQLPVNGAESARAVRRGHSRKMNQLLPDW